MPRCSTGLAAFEQADLLPWMLSAMDVPDYPAIVHGYGSVIGTGNAVVEWNAETRGANGFF